MDAKILCLGVISAGACSGYELKKTVEEDFHHFYRASYGSIYPALAELERSGLVAGEAIEQAKRPDKKVYRITDAGRAALADALAAEEPAHTARSEFLVLMYFAHLLTPDRAAQVIDTMTAHFERVMLADVDAYERRAEPLTSGQRFAVGFGRTVLNSIVEYLRRERDGLIDELIAERADQPAEDRRLAAAGD
ncbi:MAG: PadR family transcriptional regulator [Pseudomonadota bacterium]